MAALHPQPPLLLLLLPSFVLGPGLVVGVGPFGPEPQRQHRQPRDNRRGIWSAWAGKRPTQWRRPACLRRPLSVDPVSRVRVDARTRPARPRRPRFARE